MKKLSIIITSLLVIGILNTYSNDRAICNVKGKVKSINLKTTIGHTPRSSRSSGETFETFKFTEEGVWDELANPKQGVKLQAERDIKGRLIKVDASQNYDKGYIMQWEYNDDGTVAKYIYQDNNGSLTHYYIYSNKVIESEFVSGKQGDEHNVLQITYDYLETDKYGNWTKRKATVKDDISTKEFDESCEITYYENAPQAPIKPPYFHGGNQKVLSFYMSEYLNYPKDARKAGKSGKVVIKFTVETDGRITNPVVERSIYPSLDAEAIRFVKLLPKMNPAMQGNTPVKSTFRLPINFTL